MAGEDTAAAHDRLQQAYKLQQRGRLEEAAREYELILRDEPQNYRVWHFLGVIAIQMSRPQVARDLIAHALELRPEYADAHYDHGNALFDLGQHAEAIASYDRAIKLRADYMLAHNNRGLALSNLGRLDEAIDSFNAAIAIQPDNASALGYRGAALHEQSLFDSAIASFDEALAIDAGLAEVHNGRGNALARLGRYEEALASFDQATAAQPGLAAAFVNGGNVLKALGKWDAAIARYDQAIAASPGFPAAYYNRAEAHRAQSNYPAAAADFEAAASLDPTLDYLSGQLRHVRMRLCDWRGFDREMTEISMRIEHGEAASPPFPILALTGSARLQRRAAEIWVRREFVPGAALGAIPLRLARTKVRVGYFSPDFHDHPVAALIAGVIENHDRSHFEISAFSFGRDIRDATRRRLENAFDRFIDVRHHADRDTAQLARDMEIDIAVDLAGFTAESRPGIFALRAAPLQVSYLGYLGTMGASYIDYLIADRAILPASARAMYAEKILYLPCYLANHSGRAAADRVYSRQELGLPSSGMVYCCFNANYKITPAIFSVWMRILSQVPGSVLLLYAGNAAVEGNLRREAGDLGIDPQRLVFGSRLPFAEYLARYRAADLFLDTLPYNAGTTAADALWMGLPVLTCPGESFAGRVAMSLLTAMRMPELIASTTQDYERMAIELAADPPRLAAIRTRLAAQRLTTPLFDAAQFTRCLETAFQRIWRRHQSGLPPEHIGPEFD